MRQTRLPWVHSIPMWYSLGIHNKTTLEIKVHERAMHLVERLTPTSPIIRYHSEVRELRPFVAASAGHWGFGEVLRHVNDDSPWVVYHCPLPVFKRRGDLDAQTHHAGTEVRLSLSLLFAMLRFPPEVDTGAALPQFVIIDGLLVERGPHGAAIEATLTPAMLPFLTDPSKGSLESVRTTMITVDRNIWQEDERMRVSEDSFRVTHRPPAYVHLCVPGNACGLDPDPNERRDEQRGYRLYEHNVDSGLQQLTLLMGIARLSELGQLHYQ